MINYVTDGEKLCYFLEQQLLSSTPWEKLTSGLNYTGRAEELINFFRQVTVVNLTGRLVIGGASLAEQEGGIYDPSFEKKFRDFLLNTLEIPFDRLDETYRFTRSAINASQQNFSDSLRHKMRVWAKEKHSWCYLCGVKLNFDNKFDNETPPDAYTCEHIWPRAYGGNSIEDNLLPACSSCNSGRKRHFATWAMPAIQSLILGFNPKRLNEIEGSYKFALHYKIAQKLANQKGLTMKQAFLELGAWTEVSVTHQEDVADFFNLENYQDRPHLHL